MNRFFILLILITSCYSQTFKFRTDSLKVDEGFIFGVKDRSSFFTQLNDSNQVVWLLLSQAVRQQIGASSVANAPDDTTLSLRIEGLDTTIQVKPEFLVTTKQGLRSDMSDTISFFFADDTTELQNMNIPEGRFVYLKQLSATYSYGGGFFYAGDSIHPEGFANGGYAYDHGYNENLQLIRPEMLQKNQINVLWCGADPTGINESTEAYLRARKKRNIYFPGGLYKISINETANYLEIHGEGQTWENGAYVNSRIGTKFMPVDTAETYCVRLAGNYIRMYDIMITDGPDSNNEPPPAMDSCYMAIYLDGASSCILSDIQINDGADTNPDRGRFVHGIYTKASFAATLKNVTVWNCDYGLTGVGNQAVTNYDACRFMRSEKRAVVLDARVTTAVGWTNFNNCSFEGTRSTNADTLIELINVTNVNFTALYNESYANPTGVGTILLLRSLNDPCVVNIYGSDIAHARAAYHDYPIKTEGSNINLNIYGGVINYKEKPILTGDDGAGTVINLWGVKFIKSGGYHMHGTILEYTDDDYTEDWWNTARNSVFQSGSKHTFFNGGGFSGGIAFDNANVTSLSVGDGSYRIDSMVTAGNGLKIYRGGLFAYSDWTYPDRQYVVHETFEGVGSDEVWTTRGVSAGTWDPDTTVNDIVGNECGYIQNFSKRIDFTGVDTTVNVSALIRVPSSSDSNRIIFQIAEGEDIFALLYLIWRDNANPEYYYPILYYSDFDTSVYEPYEMKFYPDTSYYFRLSYNNGTGSDGEYRVYYDDFPFTGWKEFESMRVLDADDTQQFDRLLIGSNQFTAGMFFDEIMVNTAGDFPIPPAAEAEETYRSMKIEKDTLYIWSSDSLSYLKIPGIY
jgi:hypothetical protein